MRKYKILRTLGELIEAVKNGHEIEVLIFDDGKDIRYLELIESTL